MNKNRRHILAVLTVLAISVNRAIGHTDTGVAQPGDRAHSSERAQVKQGTLKEANASWWGFDKDDATTCLQAAINSGVPKLIVDNMGSDWIVDQTIQLVSNQEIDFADGVVVLAKKNCFKSPHEALFHGSQLNNITLRGQGTAVLRMNKADYQNKALYKQGEWRHGISLNACTNVVIRDLTVKETGGDGLYLGAGSNTCCKNVLVQDVTFDGNNRLGMAVISADNLLVRRCKAVNTLGTNPQGGIDFEPNYATERLTNCVVEDSDFSDNTHGAGIDISPNHLNSSSQPVSIKVSRCTISNNSGSIEFNLKPASTPVSGDVEFDDCQLVHNSVLFTDPVVTGIKIVFKNSTIDNRGCHGPALTVMCERPTDNTGATPGVVGNIAFDNTTVVDDVDRAPMAIIYQGSGEVSDSIGGTLYVNRGNGPVKYDLAALVGGIQANISAINAQKPAVLTLDALRPPAAGAPRVGNSLVFLRDSFTFVQYAQQGQPVTITARVSQVNPYINNTDLQLVDPDGAVIDKYSVPPDGKPYPIAFTAASTGLYRVTCAATSQRVDITSPDRGNGIAFKQFQRFLPIRGKLYFQVPAGVRQVSLSVAADNGADVGLLDGDGKEVARAEVDGMQLFTATRVNFDQSEIWSIDLSKVGWYVVLRFYAPLVPVVLTNPNTLLLLPEGATR